MRARLWLAGLAVLAVITLQAADARLLPPEQVRADFRKLLERPRPALEPKTTAREEGGLRIEEGSFTTEAGERVPFVLVLPKAAAGRLPAVIALHGTGGNKESQVPLLRELAGRGFAAFAMDGRYHGARLPAGSTGTEAYQDAVLRAWREQDPARRRHPFFYDTAWDLSRVVDYLESRSELDAARVGAIGFSKGGIELWLGAALDPRLRVVVPAISIQSFRWSLENERWQGRARTIWRAHEAVRYELGEKEVNTRVCRLLWTRVLPGILDEFDGPSMIRLLAPRPLLVLSGEDDPNCPIEGARLVFAQAEEAYRRAGASDRLRIDVAPGVAHQVTAAQRQLALAWFERWLGRGEHP
jgi:dienelactone hydrolase